MFLVLKIETKRFGIASGSKGDLILVRIESRIETCGKKHFDCAIVLVTLRCYGSSSSAIGALSDELRNRNWPYTAAPAVAL